jgi:hypothetical protein
LKSHVVQLQDEEQHNAAEADRRVAATEARWKETLETSELNLAGARADTKEARQKAAQLQAANDNLRAARDQATAKTAEAAHLLAQWQDLSRRRDNYLNSALQRYHDVTRSWRSMLAVLNARRNDQPAGVVDDAELGRIQDAIDSAEDDLRQVDALNTQAAQIQRKLVKR